MKPLQGKIAIAAGASRGAGRGIAKSLGAAGATVYVAARTSKDGSESAEQLPGSVEETAGEVTARGGKGIPVRADLSDEAQVAALFRRVEEEQGRLDLLANSAWQCNVVSEWGNPFWKLRGELWREMIGTVNAYWLTGVYAARMMAGQGHGLIVYITDRTNDPSAYLGQMMWDVGHNAVDRLVLAMSSELKKHKVAVVGLNPGFMRTELVVRHMREQGEKAQREFRFDLSETTEYVGRAAAALAADPAAVKKSGQFLWGADLAEEYGFTDVDGRRVPRFDPHAPRQEYPASWLE